MPLGIITKPCSDLYLSLDNIVCYTYWSWTFLFTSILINSFTNTMFIKIMHIIFLIRFANRYFTTCIYLYAFFKQYIYICTIYVCICALKLDDPRICFKKHTRWVFLFFSWNHKYCFFLISPQTNFYSAQDNKAMVAKLNRRKI